MKTLQLLTIIAEESLTNILEKEIVSLGAKGYTSTSASGKGLHQVRDNQWEGENVKIETITTEENCKLILAYLEKKYFDKYALIAFYHPVNVVRTSHFS
jgi:hypothetical protein